MKKKWKIFISSGTIVQTVLTWYTKSLYVPSSVFVTLSLKYSLFDLLRSNLEKEVNFRYYFQIRKGYSVLEDYITSKLAILCNFWQQVPKHSLKEGCLGDSLIQDSRSKIPRSQDPRNLDPENLDSRNLDPGNLDPRNLDPGN